MYFGMEDVKEMAFTNSVLHHVVFANSRVARLLQLATV